MCDSAASTSLPEPLFTTQDTFPYFSIKKLVQATTGADRPRSEPRSPSELVPHFLTLFPFLSGIRTMVAEMTKYTVIAGNLSTCHFYVSYPVNPTAREIHAHCHQRWPHMLALRRKLT